MTELKINYNIYVDLSKSSYTDRKNSFSYNELKDWKKDRYDSNQSVPFTFPNAKDAHGNDASTVYLQPDNAIKTIKEKNWVGRETVYKKGLLT